MSDMNGFKMEEDSKVKLEADQSSILGDEDDYEDTGELQFPKAPTKSWLVRTPKDLWTGLENLKNLDEKIHLGSLNVWRLPDGTSKVSPLRPTIMFPCANSNRADGNSRKTFLDLT
jgi:transcription initiation factor TFIIF beta subunit-like protein